jgi:mRNA interferase RelE/StbE
MYEIIITPVARKSLKTITKVYKKGIIEAIDSLKENPYTGKPLKRELTGKYSYKIGVYRVIYIVNEKDKLVSIIAVGHRATIYQ